MSRALRVALSCAGLGLLACGDIGAPIRDDLYEWRFFVPFGGGVDTVHFHWRQEELPVRVWVSEDEIAELPGLTQRALEIWEDVFLYGEFRGELVSDSKTAHVIVRGVPAPSKPVEEVVRLPSALAPECGGATDIVLSDDLSVISLPIRVYLDRQAAPDAPGLATCLALTSIHELGHALGILSHSPNSTDIMYIDPQVELPSEFDRETAAALYHIPPTVRLEGR